MVNILYQGPEYRSWHMMKQRCLNPNFPKYPIYGNRGIKVCDRWLKFSNFYEDMGPRPIGTSLERLNNDGNYEPSNCIWAQPTAQCLNQRLRHDNKSGVKGVSFDKSKNKWRADFRRKYVGTFNTLDEATIARRRAEALYYNCQP